MPKYEITKQVKLGYQVEAESLEAALAAPVPSDVVMTTLRERARDLDKAPASATVIRDRAMRAGRQFQRTYKGHALTAVVIPGGRIKLGDGSVYKNLHQATQAAIEIADGRKHAANAFQFWHSVEPAPAAKPVAAEEPTTAAEPTEPEPTPAPAAKPKKGGKTS